MIRNSLWRRAAKGMAALAVAGTPLITTLTCDTTSDGFQLFIDDDDFDTFDIIIEDDHEHCGFFDDCYYDHFDVFFW